MTNTEEGQGMINLHVVKRKLKNTIKDVEKAPQKILDSLKRTSGKLPPKVRNFLQKNGDTVITSLSVIKTPLSGILEKGLDLISGNKFSETVKELGYDKAYHLALVINGVYQLDKQEVIKLSNNIERNDKTLQEDIPISKHVTINELISATKDYMGNDKFTSYNAKSNNCQDFVVAVLKSNGLLNARLSKFIKQDSKTIFENLPKVVEPVVNALTDTGAVVDRLVEGEGKNKKTKKVKGMPYKIEMIPGSKPKRYRVINAETGFEHAKDTTLAKAKAQLHILEGVADEKREIIKKRDRSESPKKKRSHGWIEYVKKHMAGKKFGSRAESNKFFKELSVEYKKSK